MRLVPVPDGRAGVPGVQQSAAFQTGGIVPLSGHGDIVIDKMEIVVGVGVSDQEAQVIVRRGMRGEHVRRIVINHIAATRLHGG